MESSCGGGTPPSLKGLGGTRKYVRLAPSEWSELEGLWAVGDLTLGELAAAYDVSPRAVQDHMAKRGIIKGSKGAEFAEAVREEIVALELGDKDLTANRAREVRETAYENAKQIEQLVMAQIALAQREPGQILRVASALKGFRWPQVRWSGCMASNSVPWGWTGTSMNASSRSSSSTATLTTSSLTLGRSKVTRRIS